ncbi:MAG: ATP-dependent sacrificial sulfur transferase LarE [Gemmatimonadetes bacterium]|nr:ATP-dependent sacrificial sulfur transferase LarE [Gemmatimonadota bacterium]
MLRSCGSVCIGYSGGVDSVFLARVAADALGAERVLAVTGRSAAYPAVQLEQARECARRFGIPHLEIWTDELSDPNYAANPTNRCYFCKTELWGRLQALAAERGLAVVLDGSNADDVADFRPGMQAAREHGVRSPLLEVGLTKAEIRALSRRLGLPTWDQPASPCLSSRLPYGLAVTPERLQQVERAEEALRALGFREFRVRHHGDAARLELAPGELARAAAAAPEIATRVASAGFTSVLLDVEGYRRGALNEALGMIQLAGTGAGRPQAAGRLLARAGLARTRVRAAGHALDIAAVAAPASALDTLAGLAPALRALGFRFIALELTGAARKPRHDGARVAHAAAGA